MGLKTKILSEKGGNVLPLTQKESPNGSFLQTPANRKLLRERIGDRVVIQIPAFDTDRFLRDLPALVNLSTDTASFLLNIKGVVETYFYSPTLVSMALITPDDGIVVENWAENTGSFRTERDWQFHKKSSFSHIISQLAPGEIINIADVRFDDFQIVPADFGDRLESLQANEESFEAGMKAQFRRSNRLNRELITKHGSTHLEETDLNALSIIPIHTSNGEFKGAVQIGFDMYHMFTNNSRVLTLPDLISLQMVSPFLGRVADRILK
jgi:hypothetical protein